MGNEIYVVGEPELTGRTFGEALLAYQTSSVIGLRRSAGVMLNPPGDTIIAAEDEIIAVSLDDETVVRASRPLQIDESAIATGTVTELAPVRCLMLGWNRRAVSIVRQLDGYVTDGSVLHVVADEPDVKRLIDEVEAHNLVITIEIADTDARGVLDGLDVGSYDQVVVLCYDHADLQYADSRALVTLLHLRDTQERTGHSYSIVSEMSDDRNRELAHVTEADDFIVSEKLISLLMTQISENRHLAEVFNELLDGDGSEIYLKPVGEYVQTGRPVNFATVAESARRRREAAIGYRVMANSGQPPSFGVVLNPDKAQAVSFSAADRVIVVGTRS